jgi:hypothetical protein
MGVEPGLALRDDRIGIGAEFGDDGGVVDRLSGRLTAFEPGQQFGNGDLLNQRGNESRIHESPPIKASTAPTVIAIAGFVVGIWTFTARQPCPSVACQPAGVVLRMRAAAVVQVTMIFVVASSRPLLAFA